MKLCSSVNARKEQLWSSYANEQSQAKCFLYHEMLAFGLSALCNKFVE